MNFRLLNYSLFRSKPMDGYFHVVFRTLCREPLATTAKDRRALNKIAIDTLNRYDVKLHAYCLLPNQLRALIEVDERVLIETLRDVAMKYSRHKIFEIGKDKSGRQSVQLFERPYTAERIETDDDFLDMLRSIHLSPVIANKVTSPDEYPWCSHRTYLGFRSNAVITTAHGLSLFAPDTTVARARYHRFIAEGIAANVRPSKPKDLKQTAHDAMLERLLPSQCQAEANAAKEESTHIELSSARSSSPIQFTLKRSKFRAYLRVY